jgi:hypothetical protein
MCPPAGYASTFKEAKKTRMDFKASYYFHRESKAWEKSTVKSRRNDALN